MNQLLSMEKPEALLFFDLSNIFYTAMELHTYVDLKKLISSLSNRFCLKSLFAFVNSKANGGLVEVLYNIGFTVYQIPYNCDALMGFKISELVRTQRAKVVIIGTHDGDFRGICDELEQEGFRVYFLGFKGKFSSFLRSKPCLLIESPEGGRA